MKTWHNSSNFSLTFIICAWGLCYHRLTYGSIVTHVNREHGQPDLLFLNGTGSATRETLFINFQSNQHLSESAQQRMETFKTDQSFFSKDYRLKVNFQQSDQGYHSLYTPTHLISLISPRSMKNSSTVVMHYVLVDCWHHRILMSADLSLPISRWNTLADDIGKAHSIAYDTASGVLITEDSVRNAIVIFRITITDSEERATETADAHDDHDRNSSYRHTADVSLSDARMRIHLEKMHMIYMNGAGLCVGPHRSVFYPRLGCFFVLCALSARIIQLFYLGGAYDYDND